MKTLILALTLFGFQTPPPNPGSVEIQTIHVQGNVYMLAGGGANVTVQVGNEGVLIVDTQSEQLAPKIVAAIRKLSDKPILWIINTDIDSDHIGGNEAIPRLANAATRQNVRIIAHENVVNRMAAAPRGAEPIVPDKLWPNDEYSLPQKDFSFNGEAVVINHMPSAHTDGDSIVYFRGSDVIVAGDLFRTDSYPVIDVERGGNIQGVIDGLNRILDMSIAEFRTEGGTMVVPGHGRLCDSADVAYYRDMVTIVRDRVQDMIKKGMTLQQIKAARPTKDYDPRYGKTTGPWTTDMFIEAVYQSLIQKK